MDKEEKRRLKEKIAERIDLANGRFTDSEIERLSEIVDNRSSYDGLSKTRRSSYKTFDSEDTYRVEESQTYSFHDDDRISIKHETIKDWDDGQHDVFTETFSTARGILNVLSKLGL